MNKEDLIKDFMMNLHENRQVAETYLRLADWQYHKAVDKYLRELDLEYQS